MKISFERMILLGFIINLIIVLGLSWTYTLVYNGDYTHVFKNSLNNIMIILLLLSVILLTVVYFIIRKQFKAKNLSEKQLFENKQLLQSIIDNTSSPIFIKKLNGEYIFANKEFLNLYKNFDGSLIGKTDYDFLPKETADLYRNSDFEVVKALRELKSEETVELADGTHTFIAIKFPIYDSTGRIYAIGGISTDITQRKKAEETLKEADTFFKMSSDAMVITSGDHFVKINPSISKILGYSENELLSQPFYNFIHPEDIERTKKEFEKLQSGVSTLKFENRWITKDKSVRWFLWAASPDISTNLIYAVAHDITERKGMEDSLEMAENFFNMSFDALVVGKGDYFIKINPAFTKTFGYTQADMNSIPFYKVSANPEKTLEAIKLLKEGGELINFTTEFVGKDGVKKWVNWNATYDKEKDLIYGVCRDITQVKNDEEKLALYTKKLEEDEKQIEDIFDGAPDPVIIIDARSRVIKWNPMAEKVFGWTKDEVLDRPIYDFLLPSKYIDEHKKGMQRYLDTGISPYLNKHIEMEALDKNGKTFPVSLSISPLKIEDMVIFIGFVRDITESKKMIDEIYENEETLRLIIENIGDGVLVANSERKVVMANEMVNQIFGITDDENIPLNLTDHYEIYYPDERTVFPSQNLPMERALAGEETNDVDIVLWNPATSEKKRILASGRPLVDLDNKVVAAVITMKDISSYKQMEQELRDTESEYRQLIGFRKEEKKEEKIDEKKNMNRDGLKGIP